MATMTVSGEHMGAMGGCAEGMEGTVGMEILLEDSDLLEGSEGLLEDLEDLEDLEGLEYTECLVVNMVEMDEDLEATEATKEQVATSRADGSTAMTVESITGRAMEGTTRSLLVDFGRA